MGVGGQCHAPVAAAPPPQKGRGMYIDVSKSFETCSINCQPMAVHECVRCAWEQGTSPLSMPSGVAVWAFGVAQHECLSPHVPSHL